MRKSFLYRLLHSMPVQLLVLHLRRYQILLLFWLLIFLTIQGSFAKVFGAEALFLAPEYLGKVGFYSTFILGAAYAMFVLSWHITTFILNSRNFRFLVTTSNPFGKYFLNNSILPIALLIYFIYKLFVFQRYNELSSLRHIFILEIGLLSGFAIVVFISLTFFLDTDKGITKAFYEENGSLREILKKIRINYPRESDSILKIETYLNLLFQVKRARKVEHYSKQFLDTVFRKHHGVALFLVLAAFVFLIISSYLNNLGAFRIPAGASIIIFIAVLIGISGAFAYFLGNWSILVLLALGIIINAGVKYKIIDTRSKASGMNYKNNFDHPLYNYFYLERMFTEEMVRQDSLNTIAILNRWRAKFPKDHKPAMALIAVSGGGSRSATWTMDVLRNADRLLEGQLMQHTALITGASGGMIAASYFRQLYLNKLRGEEVDLWNKKYLNNISKDLLNSVMASFAINDFFTPFRNFRIGDNTYPKDRGFAFEQQLNINLDSALDLQLKDYKLPEEKAEIPLLILSPTIIDDGRKLLISPQGVSYLTRPTYKNDRRRVKDIDGVDFQSYFSRLHPEELLFTTAIRMNATFPYILPNVFLPSKPQIEVMDAGLRDNFGKELSLRFLHTFKDWINEHVSNVVLIQIRDQTKNYAFTQHSNASAVDRIFNPLFNLQHNLFSLQDYEQDDLISYASYFMKIPFQRLIFQYIPRERNKEAALNWHLTEQEKLDIANAIKNQSNGVTFQQLQGLITPRTDTTDAE